MIVNFGDRAKSRTDMPVRSPALSGGTNMFRRLAAWMGLPAIAGFGLLLASGPAKSDTQGWPLAGNWDAHGGSGRSFFGRSSFRSSPDYYGTYQTWIPQSPGYYGSVNPDYRYYYDGAIGMSTEPFRDR